MHVKSRICDYASKKELNRGFLDASIQLTVFLVIERYSPPTSPQNMWRIIHKIVEGVSFGEPSERDGASSRNFSAEKYPCDTKLIPRKIL